MVALVALMLALSISAEVVTYDDAPEKTVLKTSTSDVVVFNDGFTCPSAYIFNDVNETGEGNHTGTHGVGGTFNFSYINEKRGTSYGISDIKELDIPEGFVNIKKYGFTRVSFTRISIPKTVTTIGSCAFEKCASLQECVFEHDEDSGLTTLSDWIFQGTALTAISLPDCIQEIKGNCHFAVCENLTAVYLPKSLTTYTTSTRDGESSFYNCQKMYFVNEPFTYNNIPTKPQVYYFPSGLTTISGESFKKCTNLNEIVVFPVGIKSITNQWAFEAGTNDTTLKHVVFLGDMESLNTNSWKMASGSSIIFANENDKDSSCLTTNNGGHKRVYCVSDTSIENHLAEPKSTKLLSATCEDNQMEVTYCFCGKQVNKVEVENTKLGHEYDLAKGAVKSNIEYTNYLANGTLYTQCARCEECQESEASPIISDFKGFSSSEKGDGVTFGYVIDYDALNEYVKLNGKNVELGFVVALQSTSNDDAPDLNAATSITAKVVTWTTDDEANLSAVKYTGADFIIRGDWTGHENTVFCMAGYLIDGEDVSYLNAGSSSEKADTFYYGQFIATEE